MGICIWYQYSVCTCLTWLELFSLRNLLELYSFTPKNHFLVLVQFSVTDHFTGGGPGEGQSLPGVFFFYDLSPIKVCCTLLFLSYMNLCIVGYHFWWYGKISVLLQNLLLVHWSMVFFFHILCSFGHGLSFKQMVPFTYFIEPSLLERNNTVIFIFDFVNRWNLQRKGCPSCTSSQMCVLLWEVRTCSRPKNISRS